ncbi:helix-turn-helix domain-containing protein [Aureispira sp. CCB-QB1]|uniref:AlbA family DNA-binding domain-containing protein n=1 Tax=Aureispira sp. CCB-QB1 TaxID=1313421 RepID=UPI000697D59B|nr:ATP-binding protein [Aureispira sp. CCB-QB1]
MFAKHVSDLKYSDIEYLVNDRKEQEGYHLDYKKSLGNPDRAKNELAKDISSFANSNGGYLIIGVNDNLEILGVDKEINNKPIDEWLNQVVGSNIEPNVLYYDPKIIDIPSSNKVLVVIHIPESTKKPHMVSSLYTYYVRINDSSKKANHYQIRDMFEFSRNRTSDFNKFLEKKNLLDEDDPNFGINRNSKKLWSMVPEKTGKPKPVILFSLIPQYPNEEKIKLPITDLKMWLEQNKSGLDPLPSKSLYYTYQYDLKLDSIVLKVINNNSFSSYFEIANNGYVEAGFSDTFTSLFKDYTQEWKISTYLSHIISYEMLLLEWARKLYEMMDSFDDVLLQISFNSILDFKLYGFNSLCREDTIGIGKNINKQHTNLKLNFAFNPRKLTKEDILDVAKRHSEQICRVFGIEKECCFVENKISPKTLFQL